MKILIWSNGLFWAFFGIVLTTFTLNLREIQELKCSRASFEMFGRSLSKRKGRCMHVQVRKSLHFVTLSGEPQECVGTEHPTKQDDSCTYCRSYEQKLAYSYYRDDVPAIAKRALSMPPSAPFIITLNLGSKSELKITFRDIMTSACLLFGKKECGALNPN